MRINPRVFTEKARIQNNAYSLLLPVANKLGLGEHSAYTAMSDMHRSWKRTESW